MRFTWFAALPVSLTLVLAFIILVPVIQFPPSGRYTVCDPRGCLSVVQYTSVSYAYGGFGAVYQTGVNRYFVGGWMCSCPVMPLNATGTCVCSPPTARMVWIVVGLLILADFVSIIYCVYDGRYRLFWKGRSK